MFSSYPLFISFQNDDVMPYQPLNRTYVYILAIMKTSGVLCIWCVSFRG